MRLLTGLLVLACCWTAGGAESPGVLSREFLYDGTSTPECHASTIVETPKGLVAAWFGGTEEKHPDVGIWLSRHLEGTWSKPLEVANGIQATRTDGTVLRHPCWNPVLFQQPGGPLLLFFKVGPTPDSWWGMLTTSDDHGVSWDLPRRLPEGILGPVKNKPVLLANNVLLCPTSSEHDGWRVHFELTPDLGKTWLTTGPIHEPKPIDGIQPSILFHPGHTLQAVGRSRQGKLFETWSSDQGRTWTKLSQTNLPNPNSGTDAVTLKDGRHLIVYNHTARGRSPLNIAVSADGTHWKAAAVLENTPGSEFSYPAVIQAADGRVHITYTWKRQKVSHIVVDPAQLVLTDLPALPAAK